MAKGQSLRIDVANHPGKDMLKYLWICSKGNEQQDQIIPSELVFVHKYIINAKHLGTIYKSISKKLAYNVVHKTKLNN